MSNVLLVAEAYAREVRKRYFEEGEHCRSMCNDTFERAIKEAFIDGTDEGAQTEDTDED